MQFQVISLSLIFHLIRIITVSIPHRITSGCFCLPSDPEIRRQLWPCHPALLVNFISASWSLFFYRLLSLLHFLLLNINHLMTTQLRSGFKSMNLKWHLYQNSYFDVILMTGIRRKLPSFPLWNRSTIKQQNVSLVLTCSKRKLCTSSPSGKKSFQLRSASLHKAPTFLWL